MKQFITILSAIILMAIASFTTQAQNSQQFDNEVYTSVSEESRYFPCPKTIQIGDFVYQLRPSSDYSHWYDLTNAKDIPSEALYSYKVWGAIENKLKQKYSNYDVDIDVICGTDLRIIDNELRRDYENKRKQTVDDVLAKIVDEDCTESDNVETETTTSGTNIGYYGGTSTASYGSKPVHVKSYTRVQNGKVVHVSSHYRSAPRRR